jgi:histone acetyltransferase (RNA polymerase elongator complex component)
MNVDQIDRFIGERLLKIPVSAKHIEIAFFGGNFTGQKDEVQRAMLKVASKYIDGGRVASIRISTRPDEIDHDRLSLLKEYGVRHIELGAQSMSDEVLRQAGRGHTSEDTIRASSLITDHGFVLGLQMMVGLPGDTLPTTLETARRDCAAWSIRNTRISFTCLQRDPFTRVISQRFVQAPHH